MKNKTQPLFTETEMFGTIPNFRTPLTDIEQLKADERIETRMREPLIYDHESWRKFFVRVRDAEVTASEVKLAWVDFKANKEKIKTELLTWTKKDLARLARMRSSGDKKEWFVSSALHTMQSYFNPGESICFSPMEEGSEERAYEDAVEKWTDDRIQQDKRNRDSEIEKQKEADSNPQTLSDFEQVIWKLGLAKPSKEEIAAFKKLKGRDQEALIKARGRKKLTDDQLAKYDALKTEQDLTDEARQKAWKETIDQVELGEIEMTLTETVHTRDNYPLFVVQLSERVDRAVYDELNIAAKQLSGWYSAYSKNGAIPGFQFKEKDKAERFMALREQDVSRADIITEREEESKGNAVEKLRSMADRMTAQAEDSLNADRQVNTVRRANIADSAEATARHTLRTADTMRNIASAIEDGRAKFLSGIRTRTQIETLERLLVRAKSNCGEDYGIYSKRPVRESDIRFATYPFPHVHKSTLMSLCAWAEKTAGVKRAGAWVRRHVIEDWMANLEHKQIHNRRAIEDIRKIAYEYRDRQAGRNKWHAESIIGWFQDYLRMQNAQIDSIYHLRAALREFLQYQGVKREEDPIKRLERELVGTNITGFFPTPPTVASEMIHRANLEPGFVVLEPSAGKGDLADAARAAGCDVEVCEIVPRLRELLKAKGYEPDGDFMQLEVDPIYDRVLMNPPFENDQDEKHIQRAYDFLKHSGVLVAICSSVQQNSEFQQWVESVGGIVEPIKDGAFAGADSFRKTGVNTSLIVIRK